MKAKRGRLSSIDLLPEVAQPDIAWAYEEIKARNKPQNIILDELNARLADRGLQGISKSAFNRRVLWLMGVGDSMMKAREIAGIMAEKLDKAPEGDVGLLLNEMVKTIVFDILSGAQLNDKVTMNMAVNAATALDKLENARKISVETRARIARDFQRKASDAVDQVAKSAGLSAATVTKIKEQLLGVKLGPKK